MTTIETAATAPKTPALIAFGRMRASRIDQGAWFAEAEAARVKKAALNAGITWFTLVTDEEREAAKPLAEGVVTEGGRFSLSPITVDVLANLQRLRDIARTREPEELPAKDELDDVTIPTDLTDPWERLSVGSVVLAATFDDKDDFAGWWEAVIVGTEPNGFSVRWRDYPDDPTVIRENRHIAIMHRELLAA